MNAKITIKLNGFNTDIHPQYIESNLGELLGTSSALPPCKEVSVSTVETYTEDVRCIDVNIHFYELRNLALAGYKKDIADFLNNYFNQMNFSDTFELSPLQWTPTCKQMQEFLRESLGIDEPLFILRAKDELAPLALSKYFSIACESLPASFTDEIESMIRKFQEWQKNNPDKVRLPD